MTAKACGGLPKLDVESFESRSTLVEGSDDRRKPGADPAALAQEPTSSQPSTVQSHVRSFTARLRPCAKSRLHQGLAEPSIFRPGVQVLGPTYVGGWSICF